jgi:kynurenine formamidase
MQRKALAIAAVVGTTLGTAGIAVAASGFFVGTSGGAGLTCPAGMSRLGHPFDETASVFPGDPPPHITVVATVEDDGFLVELVETGTHTGTHIDAPGHFISGGRTVDELAATEFVWPAYVIDVRDRMAAEADDGFQLSVADIRAYERRFGRIPRGAMVIIQTGFDAFYGTDAFLDAAPGFSADAVQWMVDRRNIGGVGSDTFGPDASSDADFGATFTILANDRVALPGLDNVDALSINKDIIIASAVPLVDGSGYQVDPLACHGVRDR